MAENFSGRVFFANDIPAKGVEVRVFDRDEPGKQDDDLTVSLGESDDDGRFTVGYELSRYLDYTEIRTRVFRNPPRDWRLVWRTYSVPDVTDVLLPYLEFRYTHSERARRHTEWLVPFATEFRLPENYMPDEGFQPSRHGFKFGNSFSDYPLPFSVPDVPGLSSVVPETYGLCGGMSSAACDFYLAGKSIPADTEAPGKDSPLYQYIYYRQLNTFGTLGQYIAKFAAWTALPDDTIFGTQKRTYDEFGQIRAKLDDKMPVVLGLVYVSLGETTKLWENHQVLAHSYSEVSDGKIHISIYEPNRPEEDDVIIEAERVKVESRLLSRLASGGANVYGFKCARKVSSGARKKIRGFFMMPYEPTAPPSWL